MRIETQLSLTSSWSLLARQRHGHLAVAPRESSGPQVRSLHHALLDGRLYFHGSPRSAKRAYMGCEAVFECVEVIAPIPSYWIDPHRACPATTYYRSVQVKGRLVEVGDLQTKARALAALMARLQPEGGYDPIDDGGGTYRRSLQGLHVFALEPEEVTGRVNVGQRRGQETMHRVLRGLWERGLPTDLPAIEAILDAREDLARPRWLEAPAECHFQVHPTPAAAEQAALLLRDQYWNGPYTVEELQAAQLVSSAWIGVRDSRSGALVATSAAIASGPKHAWIFDVAIAETHQARGIGSAMLDLLLDHPAIRAARIVCLRTLDAHPFYRRHGFQDSHQVPNPTGATTMLLERSP